MLAGALKTTRSRVSSICEIDLPRRFWLRTDDERLRANGELFTLLRQLPDDAATDRLDTILRELAAPECRTAPDRC